VVACLPKKCQALSSNISQGVMEDGGRGGQ
jgi:hypothetical protein